MNSDSSETEEQINAPSLNFEFINNMQKYTF